jgi:hypothetical protein
MILLQPLLITKKVSFACRWSVLNKDWISRRAKIESTVQGHALDVATKFHWIYRKLRLRRWLLPAKVHLFTTCKRCLIHHHLIGVILSIITVVWLGRNYRRLKIRRDSSNNTHVYLLDLLGVLNKLICDKPFHWNFLPEPWISLAFLIVVMKLGWHLMGLKLILILINLLDALVIFWNWRGLF